MTAAWAQNAITWATQPTSAGTTVTSDTATGWHAWAVTSIVQAMYAGTNYGFVLKDVTEAAAVGVEQKYDALEDTTATTPELLLTYG